MKRLLYVFLLFLTITQEGIITKANPHGTAYLSKIVSGAGGCVAAIALHIASEYPIVYAHETGHALGGKLTGALFNMHVWNNWNKGIYFLIMPFQGCASNNGTFLNLIGGPIAGMIACYATLASMRIFKSLVVSKKSFKKSLYKGLAEPWTTWYSMAKKVIGTRKNYSSSTSLFWKSFFTIFFTLKLARITGEFLNGATPISFEVGSDGEKLWCYKGIRPIYVSFGSFVLLANVPLYLAIGYGLLCRNKTIATKVPFPAQ